MSPRSLYGLTLSGAALMGAAAALCATASAALLITFIAGALGTVGVLLAFTGKTIALVTLAIAVGASQELLATIAPTQIALLADDMMLVLAVISVAGRFVHERDLLRRVVPLLALTAILAFAVVTSADARVGVLQARQVFIPAVLILLGHLLTNDRLRNAALVQVGIGVVAAMYSIYEVLVERPLSPLTAYYAHADSSVFLHGDLPGNYLYYTSAYNEPLIRAGGLFLNPTTNGLFLGVSAVVAAHLMRGYRRLAITGLLLAGLVPTLSRGGFTIVVAGLLAPALVRRIGFRATAVAALGPIVVIAEVLLGQGGTIQHVEGLVAGVHKLLDHPFGAGFGHVGNYAVNSGTAVEGDSLLGSIIAATGILGLMVFSWLVIRLVRMSLTGSWTAWLGVGACVAVIFSETATAANATVLLWLITGKALTHDGSRPLAAMSSPIRRGESRCAKPQRGAGGGRRQVVVAT